ncbi:AAA family ATPase [Bradyrhizobium sp. Leo121]|uniref:AAA family ATPase n=1 Tax=Bradyrhizobium sp. Leo121 TaxID=1571195 RepID=UPI001A91ADA6|nr:AAA family ATPase [Bradyrhizobium sp. Leo121]
MHRYRFALQDTDIRADDDLRSVGGDKFGRVVAVSLDNRTIDIKKRADTAGLHPEAVVALNFVDTQVLADSLMRTGEYVADHGMQGDGDCRAARHLLMALAPRLRSGQLQVDGEPAVAAAIRIALDLDESVFPVQGPPGAGKTFAGARMILALAREGRTIGIAANSHKVIRHLLDEVGVASREQGFAVECLQKLSDREEDRPVSDSRSTTERS